MCRGAGFAERTKMSKKDHYDKVIIRIAILTAAHYSGIANANQFGDLAAKIGACSKRHAQDYYGGLFDLSTKRADVFLKHFKLKIRK